MKLPAALLTLAVVACAGGSGGVPAGEAVTPADCNAPPRAASLVVDVPGNPFQALPSSDGCWIFVSISGQAPSRHGVAAYQRAGGTLSRARFADLPSAPTGMALTHDGRTLIVAATDRVTFLDVGLLTSGRRAIVGQLADRTAAGRIYVSITSDDAYAFVADENSRTISVIDLARARANGYQPSAVVGKIPTGSLPISVTLSSDERYMYATSQWAPESYGWPVECRREAGNTTNDPTPVNAQGAIHVIDVARAKTDPAHAIVADVPAGCSAVRLVLSPDGRRAYVSARNSNALLAFDVAKLSTDPVHARVGRVTVGTSPVGIAVIDDGKTVIVTNSNRFAGSADDKQDLDVVDAARMETDPAHAITAAIHAGAFPREMRVTPDGRTLILTNFGSKTIQLIDLSRRDAWAPVTKP